MDKYKWNRIGAGILVVFALISLLMGKPSSLTPLKAAGQIGAIAQYGEDRINSYTLADWIISQRGDYQIIDLRPPEDYSDYHIDGSVNIPFTSLFTEDGLAEVQKYKKNILVCGDGSRSGQAWTPLRAKGYEAYILQGGIKGWMRSIMTPVSADELDLTDIDPAQFAKKLKAMREHFTGSTEEFSTPSTDVSAAPPPPAPTAGAKKKKKSGGC